MDERGPRSIIDAAENKENKVIRVRAPDSSVCDLAAVPLDAASDTIWLRMYEYDDEAHEVPKFDGVVNMVDNPQYECELIELDESMFGE